MTVRREELSEKERAMTMIVSITDPETGENMEWTIPVTNYNITSSIGTSFGINTEHVYSFSATISAAMDYDDDDERSD